MRPPLAFDSICVLGLAIIVGAACAGPTPGTNAAAPVVSPADAGPPAPSLGERVDRIMAPVFAANPASLEQCVGGVATVVTQGGESIRGWGATSLGGTVTPDAMSLFQIGSLTKVFTGIGLARLVDEGDVRLEQSPGELLAPDLRDAMTRWPTLGALVTHHGGLPTFPRNLVDRDGDGVRDPGIDSLSPAAGYDRVHLRAELARGSASPNASYAYSNVGIGIVGLALQDHLRTTGHDATLRRLVTGDLGMLDTWGEVSALPASARPRLAQGHAIDGAARVPGVLGEMGALASAGEIVTSARDMRVLLRALTRLEPTPLDGAIARASAPLAEGPAGRAMGYAIEVETSGGVVLHRKGGNTSSYGAYLVWSTVPPVGVAVLTNCGGFSRVAELALALHEDARRP